MKARAYMPGDAWPWKKSWSAPPGWSGPLKKWLKPTSYSVAELAYVEMCPPTDTPGRCARCTMMAAFHRIIRRISRSTASSPGNQGSRSGEMVLM